MRPLRVLLVDDDEDVHILMRARLRKTQGLVRDRVLELESATDGESAMLLLRERPFDLVLSDVNMPKRTGPELALAIHEHGIDVPVVLIGVLMDGVVAPHVAGRVEKDQIVRDPSLAFAFLPPARQGPVEE